MIDHKPHPSEQGLLPQYSTSCVGWGNDFWCFSETAVGRVGRVDALIAAAGILLVGALTPGTNNLVVMTACARAGVAGALPALAGIVLGTLAMTLIIVLGTGAAFAAEPQLRTAVTAAGCLYLGWLGFRLVTI